MDSFAVFQEKQEFNRVLDITPELIDLFGSLSGDLSPLHMSDEFAKGQGFPGRFSHGNILGMMVSSLVGMDLPAQEIMIISQKLDFRKPLAPGSRVRLTAVVANKSEAVRVVELALKFRDASGALVASGLCQIQCLPSRS